MASNEQIQLSNFLKAVHRNLREETRKFGAAEAWQRHCANEADLCKYALAMKELATKYWDVNCKKEGSKAHSRIVWVYETCREYFNISIVLQRKKELALAHKLNINVFDNLLTNVEIIQLLDVGSCYNPFAVFSDLIVTAIDIAPATTDVYKCDFLNVNISNMILVADAEIKSLPINTFHVVVFSLVLEYLPTAEQRLLFCKKAYELLMTEGILIIITPDSKHANANMKFMKTWRYFLAQLGFSRIKLHKLSHINCMVFRKCIKLEIVQRWAEIHSSYKEYDSFVIPQDFNRCSNNYREPVLRHCKDNDNGSSMLLFTELPYCTAENE